MTDAEFDSLLAAGKAHRLGVQAAIDLGLAAIERRREADALPMVAAVAERDMSGPALWHVIGLMHREIGDLAAAIAALDKAVASHEPTPRLLHAIAHATREAGLPSIDLYRRARAATPNDGDVILGEAAALMVEGHGAAADNLLRDMLRIHPGWYPGHSALIKLRHGRDRQTCFAAIDQAIAGCPGDWRLHQLKVVALIRAGDAEGATAALTRVRSACGNISPVLALAAMVATEFGSIAEADAAFSVCNDDDDSDLGTYRLRHFLRRGEPERVLAQHTADLASVPAYAWPYLSAAWRLLGDPRSAWLDDPRLVQEIELDLGESMLETLASCLRKLHDVAVQPIDQSVRGGTQTDGPLFSRVESAIAAVREKCHDAVRAYIAALPPPDPVHPLLKNIPAVPRFAGSWSVRLTNAGYHVPHVHTHGWLSSALYVSIPDIALCSDEGALALGAPDPSLDTGIEPGRTIRPRPGRLVLFPSTLWHGTLPFSAGERLTVAFDVS